MASTPKRKTKAGSAQPKKARARPVKASAPVTTPSSGSEQPEENDPIAAIPRTIFLDLRKALKGALKPFGGSEADDWNEIVASQAISTLWKTNKAADDAKREEGVLVGLLCMKPQDEFEGMLMAQMIGTHNAAMECHRRAMLPEQPFVGRSEALTQANKLSRTFATLLEALNRHRGKGQQKVTVEHVHVHAGGQAVVGVVEAQGAGGLGKLEDQPHAMRSENQEREAVPVARDA
ncbi:hypothetical protein QA649_08970 [Bradyrhizobium sp. CB1717]|uniref:hypothetical protein n=1 Tax=Bradyrhizobium sp. CB1717 TaxID=3039154 RepID=UPI0024B1FF19|nr:hypothetical protein [Bradyrhizobium sp. CB1717]WFU26322.1 hypothetical protein QA649_08970 [Bradyrhizobium sp. CB1717]